ncbi:MAG: hypothetical protein ICV64_00400 [Thermoleophilia bacterium]|nr:hypothetical protein [Thermoleophilia bacterium]
MRELERELQALGRELAYPPTPDLATAVAARLAARSGRRQRLGLRPLLVAVAAAVLALSAALAVPAGRAALLELLEIGGLRVERTEERPHAPPLDERRLGERVSLDEARRRVGYTVLAPPLERHGRPHYVLLDESRPGGQVTIPSWAYADPRAPLRGRVLLTQFAASSDRDLAQKFAGPETRIESLTVAGAPALWFEGAPHVFAFRDRTGGLLEDTRRLVGNALVFEGDGVVLRIEGALSLARALRIAESLEPLPPPR